MIQTVKGFTLKGFTFLYIVLISVCGQTVSSWADFQSVAGQWRGKSIVLSKGIKPNTAEAINIDMAISGKKARLFFQIGPKNDFEWDLTYSERLHFFIREQRGFLTFFKKDTTPQLLSGDVIAWARDIDNGVVNYRAALTKTGALDLIRLALTRKEDRLHMDFSRRQAGQIKQLLEAVLEPKK